MYSDVVASRPASLRRGEDNLMHLSYALASSATLNRVQKFDKAGNENPRKSSRKSQ